MCLHFLHQTHCARFSTVPIIKGRKGSRLIIQVYRADIRHPCRTSILFLSGLVLVPSIGQASYLTYYEQGCQTLTHQSSSHFLFGIFRFQNRKSSVSKRALSLPYPSYYRLLIYRFLLFSI